MHFQKQHHKHKQEKPQPDNSPLRQLEKQLVVRRLGHRFQFAQIGIIQQRLWLGLRKSGGKVAQPRAHDGAVQENFFGHVPHVQTLVQRLKNFFTRDVQRKRRRRNLRHFGHALLHGRTGALHKSGQI